MKQFSVYWIILFPSISDSCEIISMTLLLTAVTVLPQVQKGIQVSLAEKVSRVRQASQDLWVTWDCQVILLLVLGQVRVGGAD